MAEYILKVESNCKDPAREDEFKNWYDNVHIPDVLETEGYLNAARYEITEAVRGQGKYVAVYEIETDDLEAMMAAHWKNMKGKEGQGRITDLIEVTARGIYKKASNLKRT